MTQLHGIYKCEVCGNIVEVVHQGQGTLVCCGQEMVPKLEQVEGEYAEKHSPVISRTEDEMTMVHVGKVEHPMEEDHYIEWIQLENKDKNKACRKFLNPGEKPASKFCAKTDNTEARMYCNKHGLWKSK